MNAASHLRTTVSETTTVSTVQTARCAYETTIIVSGVVAEPIRTSSKGDAGTEHDAACDFVRGYLPSASKRSAYWTAALASAS